MSSMHRQPVPSMPGSKDGTTQRQRSLPALDQPFAVDELQLDQLLALSRRLAARLRYVDLNKHSDGTWEPLFRRDETLLLADMASYPRFAWQQGFASHARHAEATAPAHDVLDLAEKMDEWLLGLDAVARSGPHDRQGPEDLSAVLAVRDSLAHAVRGQLSGQLKWLNDGYGGLQRNGVALAARVAALSPLWHSALKWSPAASAPRQQLRGVGLSLAAALSRLQTLARERLPQTLDSGHHDAAVGLLLSFMRLYARAQQDINTLGDRHFNFYHREVLGFVPRQPQPDRVHVALQADPRRSDPVQVAAGTLFLAGKDAAGQPLKFRAEEALDVSRARVAALATLRLERSADVQPEHDLGYVYAVRAQELGLPEPDAAPVPAFGGGADSHDAPLGLVIASPLLLMKEGQRRVQLDLQLDWPGAPLDTLLQVVLKTQSADVFRGAAGQLYARWLLDTRVVLDDSQRGQLLRQLTQLGMPYGNLAPLLGTVEDTPLFRQMEFHRVVGDLFDLSLTEPAGWLPVRRVQLDMPRPGQSGLRLVVQLTQEDPPVCACDPAVHGGQWTARLPLLKLQVSPRARIHPLSLLEHAALARVHLSVQVAGVRELVLHNNLGPLDASKVFAPFGPLPSTAAALVLGAPEAAAKNLDALSLSFEWSGLPSEGLQAHYQAYGPEQAGGPYTVAMSLLRDGLWRPCGGVSAHESLFDPPDAQGRTPARRQVVVDPLSVRENAHASSVPLDQVADVRDGLLRLQINHPPGAFGHAAYATLLSDAVSARTRASAWRRSRTTLPPPPYTPELQSLRLHYAASTTLDPLAVPGASATEADTATREQLLHIHPFGVAPLQRARKGRPPGVLPELAAEGNLFIGLSLPDDEEGLSGPLTLLFQMQPQGAATLAGDAGRAQVRWALLARDQWQPLDHRHVLSDTTFGLLTSGVVKLELPRGASRDNAVLDRGLYWLRVSARRDLQATARLISVQAHGLRLARVLPDLPDLPGAAADSTVPGQPLPPGRITQTDTPVPGLVGVLQPEAASGLQAAEDPAQLRLRAAERLRHKNRASLGWDFERLVLAHAPEVYKARCFMAPAASLSPGQVLVAVLPAARRNAPDMGTQVLQLDTLALQRIRRLLQERASPFAQLLVRNVCYERVQVRCSVQLQPAAQPGATRRLINRALVEYLSPWHDAGFGPRMGWQLRCEDVQAQVRRVPGVAGVSGLSLLHVVRDDDGSHHYGDTARQDTEHRDQLRARHPWGVVLPLDTHLIELEDHQGSPWPKSSGVTELAVGETLVVAADGAPVMGAIQ